MSDIPLGTIDLTALCDCPDNCPECCPTVCGCSNVPETLSATFSNGAGACSCASGSAAMTYNSVSDKWESGDVTIAGCGTTINLKFYCASGGTVPADFRMDFGGCFVSTNVAPLSASCDPLNVLFTPAASGCCGGMGVLNVTVTE